METNKSIFRELTEDEVRNEFIEHVHGVVEYYKRSDNDIDSKLEGVAFSILVLLDGGTLGLPKFIVAPDPCPEDKDFYINEEMCNYYPENYMNTINCDISGSLHESFCSYTSKKKEGVING